jgi:hypothetical protein
MTDADGEIIALVTVTDSGWPRRWYATDGDSEWAGRAPTRMVGLVVALRHLRHRSRTWAFGQYLRTIGIVLGVGVRQWHRENQRMFTLEPGSATDGDRLIR